MIGVEVGQLADNAKRTPEDFAVNERHRSFGFATDEFRPLLLRPLPWQRDTDIQ